MVLLEPFSNINECDKFSERRPYIYINKNKDKIYKIWLFGIERKKRISLYCYKHGIIQNTFTAFISFIVKDIDKSIDITDISDCNKYNIVGYSSIRCSNIIKEKNWDKFKRKTTKYNRDLLLNHMINTIINTEVIYTDVSPGNIMFKNDRLQLIDLDSYSFQRKVLINTNNKHLEYINNGYKQFLNICGIKNYDIITFINNENIINVYNLLFKINIENNIVIYNYFKTNYKFGNNITFDTLKNDTIQPNNVFNYNNILFYNYNKQYTLYLLSINQNWFHFGENEFKLLLNKNTKFQSTNKRIRSKLLDCFTFILSLKLKCNLILNINDNEYFDKLLEIIPDKTIYYHTNINYKDLQMILKDKNIVIISTIELSIIQKYAKTFNYIKCQQQDVFNNLTDIFDKCCFFNINTIFIINIHAISNILAYQLIERGYRCICI